MKLVTAGGSAVEPPFLFIEPDLSRTIDITSGLRCAVAVTEMLDELYELTTPGSTDNARRKVVLMVAVAAIVTQVLPAEQGELVNQVMLGVGVVPRPGPD